MSLAIKEAETETAKGNSAIIYLFTYIYAFLTLTCEKVFIKITFENSALQGVIRYIYL